MGRTAVKRQVPDIPQPEHGGLRFGGLGFRVEG